MLLFYNLHYYYRNHNCASDKLWWSAKQDNQANTPKSPCKFFSYMFINISLYNWLYLASEYILLSYSFFFALFSLGFNSCSENHLRPKNSFIFEQTNILLVYCISSPIIFRNDPGADSPILKYTGEFSLLSIYKNTILNLKKLFPLAIRDSHHYYLWLHFHRYFIINVIIYNYYFIIL